MNASVLFRYLGVQIASGVMMALTVLMTMIVLVDFVELTRTLGDAPGANLVRLIGLTLLRAPLLIETTLPFVFLFGVMWAMFRLNRRSELVVLRAAGVSAWRFAAPAMTLAVVIGVLAATALNPAAARLNQEFERQRDAMSDTGLERIDVSEEGVWLREMDDDGQTIIRAGVSRNGGQELEDVTVFLYARERGGDPAFERRIEAERAVLRPGFWQLSGAWESAPDVDPIRHADLAIPSNLRPRRIEERFASPEALSFWELRGQAALLKNSGFSSEAYELRWHRLAATPLILLAMSMLATAVSLRLARKGGAFLLAASGAVLGFGLFFVENLFAALGSTGLLPLAAAAWAAPLFALLTALLVIALREDG